MSDESRSILVAALWLTLTQAAFGSSFDPFGIDPGVPRAMVDVASDKARACPAESPLTGPLSLDEAVDRALCSNPRTLESWATVQAQAAALGVSKASWLPKLSANVQRTRDATDTRVPVDPLLGSYNDRWFSTQSLLLEWVIYDFGRRSADTENSKRTLEAARAAHAVALLDVFSDITHAYFGAQAAAAALSAADEVASTARASLEIAEARVARGVSPVSDALQARTALAEATLQREQVRGNWQTAMGSLASGMGRPPDETFELPAIGVLSIDQVTQGRSANEILRQVELTHPRILQGMAEMNAALARTAAAQAETLPSFSVNANSSRNTSPVAPSVGASMIDARTYDRSLSLTLNIPLFDGFANAYRIAQSSHLAEVARARLDEARQQVALDIWTAYQALTAAYRTHEQAGALLDTASESFAASKERYRVGVGSIVDLMAAQTALANARGRRSQTTTDLYGAEWRLMSRVGTLPPSQDGGQTR